jgi:hypothetical protein
MGSYAYALDAHAAASDMGRGQRVSLMQPAMLRIRMIKGSEYFDSFWRCFARWPGVHGSCLPGRVVALAKLAAAAMEAGHAPRLSLFGLALRRLEAFKALNTLAKTGVMHGSF